MTPGRGGTMADPKRLPPRPGVMAFGERTWSDVRSRRRARVRAAAPPFRDSRPAPPDNQSLGRTPLSLSRYSGRGQGEGIAARAEHVSDLRGPALTPALSRSTGRGRQAPVQIRPKLILVDPRLTGKIIARTQ